ncbi:MAG: hypothetical protein WD077_10365 [Bacteroidia bacterium]
MKCYNCSKDFIKRELTKEHIPGQNLYIDFDSQHKKNRITVPACFICNNSYSKGDEELRNWLGTISELGQSNILTKKSVKSFLRHDPDFTRLVFNDQGKVIGTQYKKGDINSAHIKNFKGLFYKQYGFPLPLDYKILPYYENDRVELTGSIISYLRTNFPWKYSGSPDIFQYIIQPYVEVLPIKPFGDLPIDVEKDSQIILAVFIYLNRLGVLIMAAKP